MATTVGQNFKARSLGVREADKRYSWTSFTKINISTRNNSRKLH